MCSTQCDTCSCRTALCVDLVTKAMVSVIRICLGWSKISMDHLRQSLLRIGRSRVWGRYEAVYALGGNPIVVCNHD
jgi:hypothetical protein